MITYIVSKLDIVVIYMVENLFCQIEVRHVLPKLNATADNWKINLDLASSCAVFGQMHCWIILFQRGQRYEKRAGLPRNWKIWVSVEWFLFALISAEQLWTAKMLRRTTGIVG